MAWMYLTPIIYPEQVVPARFRPLLELNPFTPLVRSYRRACSKARRPTGRASPTSPPSPSPLFLFGYWWFARTRKNFADVI